MSFLEFFSVVLLWYTFGWLGSTLILISLVYLLSSLRKIYELDNKANVNSWFRKAVVWLYDWIDIEWSEDVVTKSCIPFKMALIMALIACFGTYTIPVSLGIMVVSFLIVFCLTVQKKT